MILSIGHSNLTYEAFAARLKSMGVTAVADVRSAPFSRHFPQYNRDALKASLANDGIAYVFLGKELGGRPAEKAFYRDGVADYEAMARTAPFREGLERLKQGARAYRITMMCSERDPMDCHRCLLVGRALKAQGVQVEHILDDASLMSQDEIEVRLMADRPNIDMFADDVQQLTDAYRCRARKVAYSEQTQTTAMAKSA